MRLFTFPASGSGLRSKLLALLFIPILMLSFVEAYASHFRYGTLSWSKSSTTANTVVFNFKAAFRRTSYTGTGSDGRPVVGDIITETVGGTGLNFGDATSTGTLRFVVTSYSVTEDWILGEALQPSTNNVGIPKTYSAAGPYTAAVAGSARVANLNNGANGSYRMETVVTPFGTNSAPAATQSPIVTLPASTAASFTIVGSDANGDNLRYRLATTAESGVAQPSGISINSTTGVVTWNTSTLNQTNFWTLQVMIEDLDANGNVKTKTPIDFLLKIVPVVGTAPTIAINKTSPINVCNAPVNFTVTAADVDAGATVTIAAAGVPAGATFSPSMPVSGATGLTANFSWTPTAAQAGSHVIAFTVTDNTGQQVQQSIAINVSNVPTVSVNNVSVCSGFTGTLTATHNASNPSYLWSPGGQTTQSITVAPLNSTNYTVTVSNGSSACSSSATSTFTATKAPYFSVCPGNMTEIHPQNWCSKEVFYNAVAVGADYMTFEFEGATTFSGSGTGSGNIFNVGLTVVSIMAYNECGSIECSFTVMVKDTLPPTANVKNAVIYLDEAGVAEVLPADVDNGSQDVFNCSPITLDFVGGQTYTGQVCGTQEIENNLLTLTAKKNGLFTHVDFASYGTPTGSCETGFAIGACHATTSDSVVASRIIGRPFGSMYAANGEFGYDPCYTVYKHLYVQATYEYRALRFACSNIGDNNVTLIVTDKQGNATYAPAVVTVLDTIRPVLTLPAAYTANYGASIATTITGTATATDICGPVVTYADVSNQDPNPANVGHYNYVVTRTWTAKDPSNNTATGVQLITVQDVTAPALVVPANTLVNVQDDKTPATNGTATATDDSNGPVTITYTDADNKDSDPNAAGAYNYVITRTWKATDVAGNFMTGTQLITVQDVSAPTMVIPANTLVNIQDDKTPAANGTATATDNSNGPITITYTDTDNKDANPNNAGAYNYVITRTWKATDMSGNYMTGVQTVTVQDVTAPIMVVPANTVVNYQDDKTPAANGTATATDNSNGPIAITYTDASNQGTNPANADYYNYVITRTWKATDMSGNYMTGVQTVTVQDVTAPSLIVPANTVVNVQDDKSPASNGTATATDASGTAVVTYTDASNQGSNPNNADYYNYVITRTWKATDATGNSVTGVQTVTVQDVTPPVLTVPSVVSVYFGSSTAPSATGTATATDNSNGPIAITYTDLSTQDPNPASPLHYAYVITRTWTATDVSGNYSNGTQIITVVNPAPPVLTVPADVTLAYGSSTSSANTGNATATSILGLPIITYTDASTRGSNPNNADYYNYVITRTWKATDLLGRSTTGVQIITVQDTVAPVLNVPANTSVIYSASTAPSATGTATGTDNSGGPVTISYTDASTQDPNPANPGHYAYVITRTWKGTDPSGNATTQAQTITVTNPAPPTISVPANVTVNYGASTAPSATGTATGSSTIGAVTMTYADASTQGSNANNANYYNYTITRTWTATDILGRTTSGVQLITVQDVTAPSIACPASATASGCNTAPAATGTAVGQDISPVTVTYTDISTQTTNPLLPTTYIYVITRTWKATDVSGNFSTCVQVISVNTMYNANVSVTPYYTVNSNHLSQTIYLGYGPQSVTLAVSATGGVGNKTYSWSPTTGVANSTSATTSVSPTVSTTYTVTITDSKGCSLQKSVYIRVIDVRCPTSGNSGNGNDNGSGNNNHIQICHIPNGNNSNPQTLCLPPSAIATHLAHGCILGGCFELGGAATKVTCYGGNNGSINATVGGGTAPYTYSWSNGATTQDISGLTAGTYTLTATDANGKVASMVYTVSQNSKINVSGAVTNVKCVGDANGKVTLSVSGGGSSYTYLWSDGSTVKNRTNLAAGTYVVTVTDNNGCSVKDTNIVAAPTPINVAASITHVKCNGDDDGKIDITVTGGTAPYSYDWDDNNTNSNHSNHGNCRNNWNNHWCNHHSNNCGNNNNQDLNNVDAGTYVVTVTDANGCEKTVSFTVNEPSALAVTGVKSNPTCAGNDGEIDITATGGTAPYTYKWNNNSTAQDRTGLTAGTYSVKVKDANGCEKTVSFTLSQSAGLTASVSVNPSPTVSGQLPNTIYRGYGAQSVTLTATPGNGTAPYTYSWSPSSTVASRYSAATLVTPNNTTTYSVTITDANGCTKTVSKTIDVVDVEGSGNKIKICHNGNTIQVSQSAVAAHLAHGDNLGECENNCNRGITAGNGDGDDHGDDHEADAHTETAVTKVVTANATSTTEGVQAKAAEPTAEQNNHNTDSETLGVAGDINTAVFNVYPNPNNGAFTVDMPAGFEHAQIVVTDMAGKVILKQQATGKVTSMNLGNVARGTYMLQVTNGKEALRTKVSVQ
jgi:Galactose binding lectin domain.